MNQLLESLLFETGYDYRPARTAAITMADVATYIRGGLRNSLNTSDGLILFDGPTTAEVSVNPVQSRIAGPIMGLTKVPGERTIRIYDPQALLELPDDNAAGILLRAPIDVSFQETSTDAQRLKLVLRVPLERRLAQVEIVKQPDTLILYCPPLDKEQRYALLRERLREQM